MNLYLWNGIINNDRYTIYSVANDIIEAKQIAIDSAPASAKKDLQKILDGKPIIHDESTSFIMNSSAQLV